jgi:hypothetical protein
MSKPSLSDHLTPSEKKGAIEAALKGGMDPAEVFKAVLQNVFGVSARKNMIIEWGRKMGLEPSESLRIAQGANLIASPRAPRAKAQEKPQRKTPGKTGA